MSNLLLIVSSILISILFILFFQKLFYKKNIIDKINDRSSHSVKATRSGGLAIFSTLFLISVYFYLTGYDIYEFSILIPLSILATFGLYDDIHGVDFKLKFKYEKETEKVLYSSIVLLNYVIVSKTR